MMQFQGQSPIISSMGLVNALMLGMAVWGTAACMIDAPTRVQSSQSNTLIVASETPNTEAANPIIIGRVVTVLLGLTTRWYGPHVRFIELTNRASGRRYQVMMDSEHGHFIVEIPAGDYVLSRVQISEGPFMSLADLHENFTVIPGRISYVGTWRFGVDIPKYGRKVLMSIIEDDGARREAEDRIADQFPQWTHHSSITALPDPVVAESRLYEVASYPRIPRYFRRHWW